MKKRIVIFSDLDSTLLEHHSYSFEAARPAIELIRQLGIPLVFCTSKTRVETEYWREKMDNHHPFIVENGAAIYIPRGYFPFPVPDAKESLDYLLIELGTPYKKLRQFLIFCRNHFAPSVRGFGDMSLKEIMSMTDLSAEMAALARKREYDEPFVVQEDKELRLIKREAEKASLKILGGSRFNHLTGSNDKGKAILIVKDLYTRLYGPIISIGIGDSHNDLAMLAIVDQAFLVKKDNGTYDHRVTFRGINYAQGIGPEGWREAVFLLIKNLGGIKNG